MGRVVVVGSVNADRIVRCATLPRPGDTVVALGTDLGQGGKGANQACAAGRLGASVLLVAAVGDDAAGRAAVEDLRRHGVDPTHVAELAGVSTGAADVFVEDVGENFIVLSPGANHALTPGVVGSTLSALGLDDDDVLLSSGEILPAALAAAATAVRSAGVRHVHNLAPVLDLAVVRSWGPGPMVLVANEGEAVAATGEHDLTQAARRLAQPGGAAVVTLGGAGALVVEGGSVRLVTAPVVEVVDTTGAGDAFCGALAVGLAAGRELLDAVEVAVRAGAFAVTGAGARGALATAADLT